ncbi:phosphotransferase enzyme family protein [Deinococcus cellulosilyticus]|uniref:Aminoglycoside phosphotransferase n=1 Tax=Deinococcus cellulosilyticus (strain DSM 18568 / NBRC 106333 / KACC 11606 / 5516J-15) TaxID=1223518 RepID=A0A511N7K3_DEIC1|nr:phosphotransferase [Deinococcus cellulosilyticus]GEM48458.1 aminoglycoside phosphotransferase [Deinococcus cellulosilyticus NBRC 106333 = KACC 11606]
MHSLLSSLNLSAADLKPLGQAENFTFQIYLQGRPHLLRLSPQARYTPEQRQTERELVGSLRPDLLFTVQRPLPFPDGKWSQQVQFQDRAYVASLWEFLEGTFLEHPTLAQMQALGAATAHFHRRALAFVKHHPAPRPQFQVPVLVKDLLIQEHDVFHLHDLLLTFSQHMEQGKLQMALIHGDLHQSNYLFQEDRPGFIDFDDCQHAPLVMEWAATLAHQSHREDFDDVQQAYFAGYFLMFPEMRDQLAFLPLAVVVRRLWLMEWAWVRKDTSYLKDFVQDYLQHHLQQLHHDLKHLNN